MERRRFKLPEIQEMSDEEFDAFVKFYEDIVIDKLGWSPVDECLLGMWTIWKYDHKPIDKDKLDDIATIEAGKFTRTPEFSDVVCNITYDLEQAVLDGYNYGFKDGYKIRNNGE